MLFSCGEKEPEAAGSVETLMTEYSDSLSVIMSRNGRRSYHFTAPQLEGYTLAREPYREFRKGVKITTYQDDSLSSVDAVLTANYAIYYENQELWEAKGNVVVRKSDGKTLYTQQLFWNARTDKVYSNVDSKIVQNNGRDVFIGEGFESDASFKEWRFRRMKGRMEVEMKTARDSTATMASEEPAPAAAPTRGAAARPDADRPSSADSGLSVPQSAVAAPAPSAAPARPAATTPARPRVAERAAISAEGGARVSASHEVKPVAMQPVEASPVEAAAEVEANTNSEK